MMWKLHAPKLRGPLFALIFIFLLPKMAVAERGFSTKDGLDRSFFSFRLAGLFVSQPTLNSSGSTYYFAWTPQLEMWKGFGFRAELGLGHLKNYLDERFLFSTYQGYAFVFPIAYVGLEIGAGAQRWNNHGEQNFLLSINLVGRYLPRVLAVVDKVFIGYSKYYLSHNDTYIFQIGIGFNLY